ncbi:unnamed protein product [Mycena citricolor]|uniref:E3 ubiquitin protein ligase n=1 Tax=Mycena citricolor TaxID=2018698 RepID=A0AAD2HSJ8_9AGAR|nr:unnamed protein product [Mycena citricolor]
MCASGGRCLFASTLALTIIHIFHRSPSSSMESKKRPHAEEVSSAVSKKRVLSTSNGVPYVNGVNHDHGEPDVDNLELFRKEAIYRRMKHYSREHERGQIRIAELERRKNACEAGLAAMSACWSQLVQAIRLVAQPDDLPPAAPHVRDLFDMSSRLSYEDAPDLVSALEDNMNATRTLVSRFVSLGSQVQGGQDVYEKCQKAQTECFALRSEIQIIREKWQDAESKAHSYHEQLLAAENSIERRQSKTIRPTQASKKADCESPEEIKEEQKEKPSSPVLPPPLHINGSSDMDVEAQSHLTNIRDTEIEQLRNQVAELTSARLDLFMNTRSPPLDLVAKSPHYRVLLEHSAFLTHSLSETQAENTRLAEELQTALDSRKQWQDSVEMTANQTNQDLKSLILKRDNENARLRDQRDQYYAELNERRAKDGVKTASLKELQALCEARADRNAMLESQLSRHKAQLAATARNEDLMHFLLGDQSNEQSYIDDLKKRVTAAEHRTAAVNQTLSIFQDDHPNVVQHMQAEANALQELATVNASLDRYERILGDPKSCDLWKRLELQDEELQRLQLVNAQLSKDKEATYNEMIQLGSAWEALDRQLRSKVFDLREMEERLSKVTLEKAKSDNKFYASMRDKESIDLERKTLLRNQEKHGKTIERYMESERNLAAQVMSLERDLATTRKLYEGRFTDLSVLRGEIREAQLQQLDNTQKYTECRTLMTEQERELLQRHSEIQRLTEELAMSKKQIDRHLIKLKERSAGTSSSREGELEEELDRTLVQKAFKCTACKGAQFRDTVITKCWHTFCRSCVDARLSTRQRKCPSCNDPFGAANVQQIFLQ